MFIIVKLNNKGRSNKSTKPPFEIVEAVKLGADWSRLIEYPNTTHIGERIKLLHCVWQDMEALAKMLASALRVVSKNIEHLCQTISMARPPFGGLGTRPAILVMSFNLVADDKHPRAIPIDELMSDGSGGIELVLRASPNFPYCAIVEK